MEGESKGRILVVDDDASHRAMLAAVLGEEGYVLVQAGRGRDALQQLSRRAVDMVLLDIRMAGQTGLEVLAEIRKQWPDLPVVMMTAYASVETAVQALKSGAQDYLTKPLDADELKHTVGRILEQRRLQAENRELRSRLKGQFDFGSLVRASSGMREVIETLRRVSPTEATVLILGESGTGKELVANAVHQNSPRALAPFVPVNCAALPENLLESELFGYEKGAFSGAVSRREGKLLAANRGTIFLDEVAEMKPATQAKLLRFLQEREVEPLGSNETIPVDVRIIAATNRDLTGEVGGGRFREDLYYRLNVVSVTIPPLRRRVEDIPPLALYFLDLYRAKNRRRITGISDEAMDILLRKPWPGNVRELENAIERAVVLSRGEIITPADLPPEIRKADSSSVMEDPLRPGVTLGQAETEIIRRTMEEHGGNKTRAAKSLGISRQTLLNKLRDLDLG